MLVEVAQRADCGQMVDRLAVGMCGTKEAMGASGKVLLRADRDPDSSFAESAHRGEPDVQLALELVERGAYVECVCVHGATLTPMADRIDPLWLGSMDGASSNERGTTERVLNLPGVTPRTVRRDVEWLRTLGYPVYASQDVLHGRLTERGCRK